MAVELRERVSGAAASAESILAAAADSDAILVAAAKRGNLAALEEVLGRHERRIFRLAYNITRNYEDAEETLQDVFQRAFSRLDTFQGESQFSTWLTRIAINQSLMKLRKRRPDVLSLEQALETEDGFKPREIADWGPSPEQWYSQQEMREILDAAIAELKADQRVVFQLREVEEFSTEETAEALGISIAAVKSRLLRARLALREKLNQYFRRPGAVLRPAFDTTGTV